MKDDESGGVSDHMLPARLACFLLCAPALLATGLPALGRTPPKASPAPASLESLVPFNKPETEEEALAAPIREIHVRVLGIDGRPAARRSAQLIGLSRGAVGGEGRDWSFNTDAEGRFTVRLGDFGQNYDAGEPGWGVYGLHVRAEEGEDAGAFSAVLLHCETAEENKAEVKARKDDEWGRPIIISQMRTDVTLRIQPGFTISGRMLRYPQGKQPVGKNVAVHAQYNLYAESHTGMGGEVIGPKAVTDAEGRFTLRHVYPSKAMLVLEGEGEGGENSLGWIATRRERGGKWSTDAIKSVTAPKGGSAAYLEILAATGRPFRYYGQVTDTEHHPLAGARVALGLSSTRSAESWSDNHSYRETKTDEQGRYEIKVEYPYVRGFDVEAPGFQRFDRWDERDLASFKPGRYDFTVQR